MGVDPYNPRTHRFSEVKEHNGYHAVRKASRPRPWRRPPKRLAVLKVIGGAPGRPLE